MVETAGSAAPCNGRLTLPMRRSQPCALTSRDRTDSPIRTAREALQVLRIVFGDTRQRTARFPLRLRFRGPRSLIAASKWQTHVRPIGEAWNAGARVIGRVLQRRRVEDRRPARQPACGIAHCFATPKVRENYVKVWLAAVHCSPRIPWTWGSSHASSDHSCDLRIGSVMRISA